MGLLQHDKEGQLKVDGLVDIGDGRNGLRVMLGLLVHSQTIIRTPVDLCIQKKWYRYEAHIARHSPLLKMPECP
jgi:hypothetical protein